MYLLNERIVKKLKEIRKSTYNLNENHILRFTIFILLIIVIIIYKKCNAYGHVHVHVHMQQVQTTVDRI